MDSGAWWVTVQGVGHKKSDTTERLSTACKSPWTAAYQAPPPMGFPRQEYLEWVAISSSRDLLDPEIEPASPALPG